MRIKKSVIAFSLVLIVLLVIIGAGYIQLRNINNAWGNESTWSTEQKVILPKETANLKVTNKVTEGSNKNEKNFEFTVDYCYLYQIDTSEDVQNATLRCSLLPMYYVERAKELPPDWQAQSDVLLVVSKDDVEPTEYLGRLTKTFESVRSLGTGKYPVSMAINGKYTYPDDTFMSRVSHYMKTKGGGKEQIKAAITSYSVSRTDTATPKEIHDYAQKWLKDFKKELSDTFVTQKLDKKASTDYLDAANNLFKYLRIKCVGLNDCHTEYVGNPANSFMYMLYGVERWNKDLFNKSVTAMNADLYPFTGASDFPDPEGNIVEGNIVHWRVFSAYEFPVCPVNDLISGKKSENFELLRRYLTKEVVLEKDMLNAPTLLALLSSSKFTSAGLEEDMVANGGWEVDKIFAINEGCVRALEDTSATTTALRQKVLDDYYAMLSLFIGSKTDGSTESLEKIIYESNAYSPYTSKYISDFGVARYREQELESNATAAQKYIEWRSALTSYIMLYLYDARK